MIVQNRFLHCFNVSICCWRRTNMVAYTLEQRWKVGLRSAYRRCWFWQKIIIFSDEDYFDLGGYVNKQNCHIWGTENPHAYIEKPTHSKRVTQFFFEHKQGEAVTVNGYSLQLQSELQFDTVGLLFEGCRQRYVFRRQARGHWRFKG